MDEGFQEQVARLRRAQILEAAITVFARSGFHRTTIRDVAKEARVSDGTIYNYFANKTAVLMGVLDPLSEAERRDPPPEPPADIRQFFREHFTRRWNALRGENMNALRVVLSEVLVNPELRALYVEQVIAPTFHLPEPYLRQLVVAGKLRPLDIPLTLRTMTATVIGLVMLRLMEDPYLIEEWDNIPELLTTLLLDGMLPEERGNHDTL